MGVAIRVKNHKFRFPYRVATTLSSAVAVSATSIAIVDVGGVFEKFIQRGDVISIGESSDSSYTGKNETLVVESVSYSTDVTTLTLKNNANTIPEYAYDSGDPVFIYGSKFPANWSHNNQSGSTVITPLSIMPPNGGKLDRFAAMVKASGTGLARIRQTWEDNTNPVLEATCYRIGWQHKYDVTNISGTSKFTVSFNDGSAVSFIGDTISTIDVLSWRRWTKGDETTVSNADLSEKNVASLNIYQQIGGSSDDSILWLDEVFIEHASEIEHKTNLKKNVESLVINPLIDVLDSSGFSIGDYVIIHAYDTNGSEWLRYVMEIWYVSVNGQTIGVYPPPGYDNDSVLRAPDGTVEKVSNGYYEFTNTPTRDSLDHDFTNEPVIAKSSPNTLIQFNDQFEDRSTRWWFKCYFWNVDATMWFKLQKFLWWQARGHLLNFHPFIDDLPSVMTGFMKISRMTKSTLYNQTYRSFEFYFEEAV